MVNVLLCLVSLHPGRVNPAGHEAHSFKPHELEAHGMWGSQGDTLGTAGSGEVALCLSR